MHLLEMQIDLPELWMSTNGAVSLALIRHPHQLAVTYRLCCGIKGCQCRVQFSLKTKPLILTLVGPWIGIFRAPVQHLQRIYTTSRRHLSGICRASSRHLEGFFGESVGNHLEVWQALFLSGTKTVLRYLHSFLGQLSKQKPFLLDGKN